MPKLAPRVGTDRDTLSVIEEVVGSVTTESAVVLRQ